MSNENNSLNNENKIIMKYVSELLQNSNNFFIPSYQRGYRWTTQQVKDLLNDINSFKIETITKEDSQPGKNIKEETWYSLQPIVVREMTETDKSKHNLSGIWYEVIDGQQRLTTLFLIIHFFNVKEWKGKPHKKNSEPTIIYETRSSCEQFLKGLFITSDNENVASRLKKTDKDFINVNQYIDYHYMSENFKYINSWYTDNLSKSEENTKNFIKKFLNNVQVIWYESFGENPITVFTRLNVGKIPLTNSELIKALFLNSSNFIGEHGVEKGRTYLKQLEIASLWDRIETVLQDDEFWLFLHKLGYTNPTRIDYIFDIIKEKDFLEIKEKLFKGNEEEYQKELGNDDYKTFRYFNVYLENCSAEEKEDKIDKCWELVKKVFDTFNEWYSDLEFYHYIGYLIHFKTRMNTILDKWHEYKNNEKQEFINKYLKKTIKDIIKKQGCQNLDQQYSYDNSDEKFPEKTKTRPILLLHNIQTIINQSKNSFNEYGMDVFYKFPFHLFKKEKWDVEHIDSNTSNDFTEPESRNEYLLNSYLGITENLQKKVEEYLLRDQKNQTLESFNILKNDIDSFLNINVNNNLSQKEKNQIWNFTLLNASINRSYGNSIYSAKRRIIIGKDKGKDIPIPTIIEEKGKKKLFTGEETAANSSFIPPITRHIFMKYYSSLNTNSNQWTKEDAKAYKKDIEETLKEFLK